MRMSVSLHPATAGTCISGLGSIGIAVFLMLSAGHPARAQWADVTEEYLVSASTQASWFGTGMSAADFNLDGLEDLTFSNSSGTVVVYKQLSSGGFEEVHELVGAGAPQGVVWFDADGDDDLDLLVGRRFGAMELHIHEDGALTEAAEERGIPITDEWEVRGFAVADYDGDSDLDIYVCMYHDGSSGLSENLLLNNDGNGHFTDVTAIAGVGNGLQHTFQGTWFDYDHDGDLDLWVINDRQVFPNAFYENQGDGTFVDVAFDIGLAQTISAMTATVGDPDNDGEFELFCTDVENEPNLFLDKLGNYYASTGPAMGLDGNQYSWGGCWVDADGDMWSDLMVATYRFPNSLPYDNYYYRNIAEGMLFADQTEEAWPNEQTQLYCLAALDFNQDLTPDVVGFGNMPFVQMLENDAPPGSGGAGRIAVQLCGTASNRWAVGAVVHVHAGGISQMQLVTCGTDYMTQQSWRRFFALDGNAQADSIVVEWPSGLTETWYDVPAGSDVKLVEGTATAELVVLGSPCAGDSAWLVFPFEAEFRTLNGVEVASDSVLISTSGTYVGTCSWMGGLFAWEDSLSWTVLPPHVVTIEWTEPDCAGDPGLLGWVVDSNLTVSLEGTDYPNMMLDLEQPAGPFVLLTIDAVNGCVEEQAFQLPEPPELALYIEYEPALCADEVPYAFAAGFGGTPGYLVNWNGADPSMLEDGPVQLTLTDGNGCVLDSTIEVVVPEPLSFNVTVVQEDLGGDASIALDIAGGTPPYDVLWNTGLEGDTLLPNLSSGLYSWVVSDANGCLAMGLQDIINVGIDLQEGEANDWKWYFEEGALVIEASEDAPSGAKVVLRDMLGRLMLEEEMRPGQRLRLSARSLPAHGVLVITGDTGVPLVRAVY